MKLSRPFVTSAGSSDEAHSYVVRWEDDESVVGHGEASPSRRVTGETIEALDARLRAFHEDPNSALGFVETAEHRPGGSTTPATTGAVVAAALDLQGRRAGVPLHRLLNLPPGRIASSVTITLGSVASCLEQAKEWDEKGWSIFKVKLGGPDDEAVVRALRDRYPEKVLRVDANEGWSPQVARARLAFLERGNVELVEQPLPRGLLAESAELAAAFEIPIILDEPLLDSSDAIHLVERKAGDGGNIKLAKCGGVFEARRIVKVLRDAGWKIMMGCMVESSLGLATAAAFADVIDYADLDGNVTVTNDPFQGFEVRNGFVDAPQRPGIGVELAKADLEALQ